MKKILYILLCLSSSLCAHVESQKFSFNLFHTLSSHPGNIFVSPYSIQVGLEMAKIGASGQTEEEMSQVLGAPFKELPPSKNLQMAQALVSDRSFPLLPSYLNKLRNQYHAEEFSFDFRNEKKKALVQINEWVAKKTDNLIPHLLRSDDVQENTKCILLNAILFKGEWQKPFLPENTKKAIFHVCDHAEVEVPMMEQEGYFSCGEDSTASFLQLEFKKEENGPTYDCMLILPKKEKALHELELKFDAQKLASFQRALVQKYVQLFFPKFSIDYRSNLKDALELLGMKQAFLESANFSKMTQIPNLLIDRVIHQTHLKVDENGLEAAGATAVIMNLTAVLPPQQKVVMRFDRPFLILISERESGAILFLGRIYKP